MTEKPLSSWADFRDEIARIRSRYGYHQVEISDNRVYEVKNTVLFRGQSDASWPIQTTLERKTAKPMSVPGYMLFATHCANEIESVTGRSWNILPWPDMKREIGSTQDPYRVHLPSYDYLVYLRQHGFPSPLLDWTESPYIAAFFAFWDARQGDNVAVYAYVHSVSGCRRLQSPMISVRGPYVSTDRRHFAQKAWYTIATQWEDEEKAHYFCSHQKVFQEDDPEQDILIKIILPKSVRPDALRELSDYNINPFTLFQTEDALVKAMELKAFDVEAEA